MNFNRLNSFLHFGMFTDFSDPNFFLDYKKFKKKDFGNRTDSEIVDIFWKIFNEFVERELSSNQDILVPLSGGFDSRFIIGTLLNFKKSNEINTYTVGIPGALDYEIGNKIAEYVGTRHRAINLNDHKYKTDELIEISKRTSNQHIIFASHPIFLIDKYFSGMDVWSGFMGDNIMGSSFDKYSSENINQAIRKWIIKGRWNRTDSPHVVLTQPNYNLNNLIDYNFVDSEILNFDEQLNFHYRQFLSVAPSLLFKNFSYKLPFMNQELLNLMFNLPDRFREDLYLYRLVSIKKLPDLFKIKNKRMWGLNAFSSKAHVNFNKNKFRFKNLINKYVKLFFNERLNYLDFQEAIKSKSDFSKIVIDNIMDLKERSIVDWVDLEVILNDHLNNQANYSNTLLNLVSLEIHLKSNKRLLD